MRVPGVRKRRWYDLTAFGRTYKEGDRDMRACVWFLEHRDAIVQTIKESNP
jgi:hypothetical protein